MEKYCMIVGGRFRLLSEIGSGGFGRVYEGEDIVSGEKVAVKMELATTATPQLHHEYHMYKKFEGGCGMPQPIWYKSGKDFNALALQLLGPSLEQLVTDYGRGLNVKTVLLYALQMVRRVHFIHSKKIVHRDIKPSNFVVGAGPNRDKVYLIDYGFATKYEDSTGNHIKFRYNAQFKGTFLFASSHAHSRYTVSRRDDMISLGYSLIYLSRGSLPWQEFEGHAERQNVNKIAYMKASISLEELCRGCPEVIKVFMGHCLSLDFYKKPDYAFLIRILNTHLVTLSNEG